jgi:hypothetical protein
MAIPTGVRIGARQLGRLLLFGRRQTILAQAVVAIGPPEPVADRVLRRPEFGGELLRPGGKRIGRLLATQAHVHQPRLDGNAPLPLKLIR